MTQKISLPLLAIVLSCSLGAASWLTFGGNAQRNGWAKDETIITKDNVKGFQLLWKTKLDNEPRELNSLTSPIVANPVYTNHGADEYVIVGGSSDNLYALDSDSGKVVWQKHFTNDGPPITTAMNTGSYFCPGALNDTPVVQMSPAGPTVYVISIDGKLHGLNAVNGDDRFPSKQFVPAYSKNWSLNLDRGVLYTSTSQGCAKSPSGVWAMDLNAPDKPVSFFEADKFGAGIWGRGGVAVGSTGTVYAATGDGPFDPAAGKYGQTILALSPKDLKIQDFYTPTNANYLMRKDLDMGNTTPIVLDFKGREFILCSGKEGKLILLDTKSLGGDSHRTPLLQTPLYTNENADIAGRGFWGAFASYVDSKDAVWLFAPAWGPVSSSAPAFPINSGPAPNGSIMAFKVEDKNGQPAFSPAWISHDMSVPEPPIIANGVVFAISSGEFTRQVKENGQLYTTQERIQATTGNATLYAFDADTGKELFSSGKIMSSFTHFGALAVTDGRVFTTTHDSTVYAFGIKGD